RSNPHGSTTSSWPLSRSPPFQAADPRPEDWTISPLEAMPNLDADTRAWRLMNATLPIAQQDKGFTGLLNQLNKLLCLVCVCWYPSAIVEPVLDSPVLHPPDNGAFPNYGKTLRSWSPRHGSISDSLRRK